MKNTILTNAIFVIFVLQTIQAGKEDSTNIFKLLKDENNTFEKHFENKIIQSFLETTKTSSCFSPVIVEFNFLLQVYNGEYKSSYIESSKYFMKRFREIMKDLESNLHCVTHSFFLPGEKKNQKTEYNSFIGFYSNFYTDENVNQVCKNYNEWIKEKNRELVPISIEPEDLKDNVHVYYSTVSYNDKWAYKFNQDNTKEYDFTLNNGTKVKKQYMSQKNEFL